jgi:hypothetical protein
MLFACHVGMSAGCRLVGNLSAVWPLAFDESCPGSSYEDEPGLWGLWESVGDVEEFARELFDGASVDGAGHTDNWGGLWVYEVEWNSNDVPDDGDDDDGDIEWRHLRGGEFRRPTRDEVWMLLESGPRPDAPWKVTL